MKQMTEQKFQVDENMIMWAFRYALGRRTGAVMSACDHLKMHWKKLRPETRQQIQNEIYTAIQQERAGDKCDIDSWMEVYKLPNNI